LKEDVETRCKLIHENEKLRQELAAQKELLSRPPVTINAR